MVDATKTASRPVIFKLDVISSGEVLPMKRGRPSGAVDEVNISAFIHVI